MEAQLDGRKRRHLENIKSALATTLLMPENVLHASSSLKVVGLQISGVEAKKIIRATHFREILALYGASSIHHKALYGTFVCYL